jgi:hypothetical protein
MKNHGFHWKMPASLLAAALTLLGGAAFVRAAAPALNGYLTLRPLTSTEVKTYGLTGSNAQFSAGINTIGLGEPAYLEALVNIAIAPANITNVTWTLAAKPAGSTAAILPSPLGTNVPVYKTADKSVYQIAGRAVLRPNVAGNYTVNVTIQTADSGSTNLAINLTGATYLGVQVCAACHAGSFPNVPNMYHTYTNTAHASTFARAVDGLLSSHFSKNCIACHATGYDTNAFAINGGFDDVASLYGWTFPAVLTNGNWAAMPSQLQNLANVQCESCHGPGSQHVFGGGDTNVISISYAAADCSQCHDSTPNHFYAAEWNNSGHANMTRIPSGSPSRIACVRCHTAPGFIGYVQNLGSSGSYVTNYTYEAVTCQACHDPHDASNPHQLRTGPTVPLADGTIVTNAGAGGFCFNCHTSRNGSVTNSLVNYPLLKTTWNGGSAFGVHDSPQADMLEGVNAVTYGKVIPSSPHANVVSNTCVGCHMQTIASTDPAFTLAGGHTTKMSYVNKQGVTVPVTYVCAQCHGNINTFNFPVADYNNDGVIEGVQTEVQHLLDKLSTLLPPSGYRADGNYIADGLVKTPATQTNWPAKFLRAAYNWQFVNADGSLGVHNAAYAVGLLKASIGDLTGDANNDGLPDDWQKLYFGSGFATNPAAAYNAVNNPNGVPNWMMYALNLDPRGAFTVGGSGVIYFNGNNIVNGATNTIAIYTAAEIAFDTQPGVTYQIQAISALTGAWQTISTNLIGTGGTISYLAPTRQNAQMFYRVVHTP